MTRHLFRLIWNRKRHNFLLAVEIFFSFIVLFGVVLMSVTFANNWRQPLGFSIDRVWRIEVDRKEPDDDPAVKQRHRETYRQVLAMLHDLPEVEIAAGANISPYSGSSWGSDLKLQDGRRVRFGVNAATDELPEVLDIPVVAGRWFSREDDGVAWTPIVINRRLAEEIFEGGEAVGRDIPQEPNERGEQPTRMRVVGVIEEFRKDGEFASPENFLFYRLTPGAPSAGAGGGRDSVPQVLLLRVTAGTTAAFEETTIERLHQVARTWSFEIQPMINARDNTLRMYAIPLVAVGTIAVFLLLMVALGLTGVVWHSVTQRTREFGLRRAKGATIPNVRRQVLAELAIMASLALAAGVLVVVQLAVLPLDADVQVFPRTVFVASVTLSVAAIYGLTLACAWYPSRLATKIQPAEALHYE
jgi:putative ABC transport system permease protein